MTILNKPFGNLQKVNLKLNRFIFCILLIFTSSSLHAKNSLEELIIWKISDELKLPAETEKKFSETLRLFNNKKNETSQIIDGQINVLKKIESEKERQIWLDRYRKALVDYNSLVINEHDEIKKILGNHKFVKYLELKSDLNSRIKNLMLSKDASVSPGDKKPTNLDSNKK